MTVARRRHSEEASTRGVPPRTRGKAEPRPREVDPEAAALPRVGRRLRAWGRADQDRGPRSRRRPVVDPAARLRPGRGREAGPRPTPARPAAPAGPEVGVGAVRTASTCSLHRRALFVVLPSLPVALPTPLPIHPSIPVADLHNPPVVARHHPHRSSSHGRLVSWLATFVVGNELSEAHANGAGGILLTTAQVSFVRELRTL